jgi:hypothetical protein
VLPVGGGALIRAHPRISLRIPHQKHTPAPRPYRPTLFTHSHPPDKNTPRCTPCPGCAQPAGKPWAGVRNAGSPVGSESIMSFSDIDSTPAAIPTSVTPAAIAAHCVRTDNRV